MLCRLVHWDEIWVEFYNKFTPENLLSGPEQMQHSVSHLFRLQLLPMIGIRTYSDASLRLGIDAQCA